jgi:hypothetical protein
MIMNANYLRSLIRAQPFSPFTINLADGRSFVVHHHDYLIIPPERGSIVFVFHKGGDWDLVYLKQITSVSGGGNLPELAGEKRQSEDE